MADDVSTGELARRLDEVLRRLGDLVSRPEYTADQRHWEHRFTDLERDLAEERKSREAVTAEERGERKAADQKLHDRIDSAGTNRRQTLFSGWLPVLLFLVGTAVNLLLAFRGK